MVANKNTTQNSQGAEMLLDAKKFICDGETLVVKEFLMGEDVSELAVVGKNTVHIMLPAQDNKRLQLYLCCLISDSSLKKSTSHKISSTRMHLSVVVRNTELSTPRQA
ncbi:hypothetical protein GQX74_012536 [Glossina fuscipes]|nr:hypothetical protein GQX74_012536 [Glossina fuscipes]